MIPLPSCWNSEQRSYLGRQLGGYALLHSLSLLKIQFMKRYYLLIIVVMITTTNFAQDLGLPNYMLPKEVVLIEDYKATRAAAKAGITTPPSFPVRTMAEWEEVQSLVITWTSYRSILKQIVRYAKDEVEVIIICDDANDVMSELSNNSAGGPITDFSNMVFLEEDYNSIWMRDYGAETIYRNDVDSLMLLDWIYNRPRPDDDVSPDAVAAYKNIPIYNTTQAPNDLVHTGGNFMSDGFGTAFSSVLVLEENGPNGQFNQTSKNEQQVDDIMEAWMGIQQGRYIKMETLPFDGIHHIDMHMKLLDEETLLVGEFPQGESDGPQLEANLQYVLSNFNSVFGTPYKLIRIPMPTSTGGAYPPQAYYRTFTNSVFINKTIIVPTYREEYDTIAMRIYEEALPGYKVRGIDCDNSGSNIISASGAIHCITKTIGVEDPLLISHQPLSDTYNTSNPYPVNALMKHRSGINSATLFWTTDTTAGYSPISMNDLGNDTWMAPIPAQPGGTQIFYYVRGESNSGKQQVRPIVAPEGYWEFRVMDTSVGVEEKLDLNGISSIYPNPASAITVVEVNLQSKDASLEVFNILGERIDQLYEGSLTGKQNFFIDAAEYTSGVYVISLTTPQHSFTQKLIVQ